MFPTCENGEIFDCPENKSTEILNKKCGRILMFTIASEETACSCRKSNKGHKSSKQANLKRNSNKIKKGWTKYAR